MDFPPFPLPPLPLELFGLLELFGDLDDFMDLLPLEELLPLELDDLPLPLDEEISSTSISSSCLVSGSSALPFPLELDPFMDFPPFPFPPFPLPPLLFGLLEDFGLLELFGDLDDFMDLLPLEELLPLELDELPLPLDEECSR